MGDAVIGADRGGRARDEGDPMRAEAIRPDPRRKLGREVRDEQRCREETDRGERDAVRLRERVGDRPDRYEPRVKKRRRNHYDWLTKPRAVMKRKMAKGVTEI